MVEQVQISISSPRPAEKAAESGKMSGFENAMDRALGLVEARRVAKAAPAGRSDAQPLEAGPEGDGSGPALAQASEPLKTIETVLADTEDEILPGEGHPGADEEGMALNPLVSEAFAPLFYQLAADKIRTRSGGFDAVPTVSEGLTAPGTQSVGYTVPLQPAPGLMQNGVDPQVPGLESDPVKVEALSVAPSQSVLQSEDVPSKYNDLSQAALSSDIQGLTGLQTGQGVMTGSESVTRASAPDLSAARVEGQAVERSEGVARQADEGDISAALQTEDAEMSHDPVQGNSGTDNGNRGGFQSGSGGDGAGRESSSGSGAQGIATLEARPASGFSVDQIKMGQPGQSADRPVIEAEVFERFGEGVRFSASNGMKEVRIAMHPEELGGVTIRLRVDNNTVSAHILVESQAVKGIFDSDTGRLRDIFAQNGLDLDNFSVELSSGEGFSGGFSGGEPHRWSEHPSMPMRSGYKETAGIETGAVFEYRTASGRSSGGVDLFV